MHTCIRYTFNFFLINSMLKQHWCEQTPLQENVSIHTHIHSHPPVSSHTKGAELCKANKRAMLTNALRQQKQLQQLLQ